MLYKAKALEKITIPTPFLVGPVNIYLIKSDSLTLIDTGPKTELAKTTLKQSLGQLGYTLEDIEQVIVTHHHPDHVGLVEQLFSHAKIIGHKKCDPWLRKDGEFLSSVEQFFRDFYKKHSVPTSIVEDIANTNKDYLSFTGRRALDKIVEDADQVAGLPGWTVIETPGHAQDHICLYNEKDGVLIGGDHIIGHISSNAILEAPYTASEPRPHTLIQYRNSLQKCLDLNTNKIYSGHGETVEDLKNLVNSRLNEQEQKARRLKSLIPSKGISSFDICKEYFPKIYLKEPTLTFSEIIGHLDLLEAWGEIKTHERDGSIFYTS